LGGSGLGILAGEALALGDDVFGVGDGGPGAAVEGGDAAAKIADFGGVKAGPEGIVVALRRAGALLHARLRQADFRQAAVSMGFSRFD